MSFNPFEIKCPAWLEDEALMIQTSGEMPEVALAEAMANLPDLNHAESTALKSAVAKCYLALINRDLLPENVGKSIFRGLPRAQINLGRMKGFLEKQQWPFLPNVRSSLGQGLCRYLSHESEALNQGRTYVSTPTESARALVVELGLSTDAWEYLFEKMSQLPYVDFLGLRALVRLDKPGVDFKRRTQRDGMEVMEVFTTSGKVLGRAALSIRDLNGDLDPEAHGRAQEVWRLTPGIESEWSRKH